MLPENPGLSIHQFGLGLLIPVCLLVSVGVAGPQLQRPTPPSSGSSGLASLRVTTRFVQVNVVVNDKHRNSEPPYPLQ